MSEMKSSATNTLQQVVSKDGLRVMSIVTSTAGFRFVEETYTSEELPNEVFWYWTPTHESGIYATEQEALADAKRTLEWLRNSN